MNNSTKTTHTFGDVMRSIGAFMRDRFSLEEDKASQREVVDNVERSVVFRGANVWVLVFAALIASLGLNVNSTAVVIGAMLISPLMGPIMGIGLSLGINDFELLKKSLRNYLIMTIVAIVTAFIYFLIIPSSGEASRELLARTEPTVFDVLIALFGGLAGIVAQTRKDRTSTVIPGVAIATALMPPLCTAGYGLATGKMMMFGGAFYLFFINTVFIALSAFLLVRFQHYAKVSHADVRRERRIRRVMYTVVLLTFVPSVYIGMRIIRRSIFEASVDRYVQNVLGKFEDTRVLKYDKIYKARNGHSKIDVILIGEPLPEDVLDAARAQMIQYRLDNTELAVHQTGKGEQFDVSFLEKNYVELLEEKNLRIAELSERVSTLTIADKESSALAREAGTVFDNIGALSVAKSLSCDVEGKVIDTVAVCIVTPRDVACPMDSKRIGEWLKVRMNVPKIELYINK